MNIRSHLTACSFLRGLTRSAAALLFLAAFSGLAFAQDGQAPASPSDSVSNAAQSPADGSGGGGGLLAEPRFITHSINGVVNHGLDIFDEGNRSSSRKTGWYPEFSNMITGSGMVSAGPGYRQNVFGDQAFFDISAAASWHFYKMAQARFEFPRLANDHVTIGTQAMWTDNTQVSYFGLGGNSVSADHAQYRLRTTDVVGYVTARPAAWLALGAEFGWLKRPDVLATAGTFKPNLPDARLVYPTDPGMSTSYQPDFLHSELSLTADTRDYRSRPTAGALYRAAMNTFSDRSEGTFSFNQFEAEGAQFLPIGSKNVVLAMHAWTVHSAVPSNHQVPSYLIPALGGNNTLRAYDSYQFHDLNSVVASAEVRVAMMAHIDAAAFYDAGNVAARYGDLNFSKTSIGAGLRIHTAHATFGRLDAAHGSEGWKFVFRTNDPFKLSRIRRKIASAPFSP